MNYWERTFIMVLILAGIMSSCSHPGSKDPTAGKKQQMDVLFDSINKFDFMLGLPNATPDSFDVVEEGDAVQDKFKTLSEYVYCPREDIL